MITDDELLLYYYRELEAPERARVAAALAGQPDLAQRLTRLIARLDTAAGTPEVAVPVQFQQRWQATLESVAAKDVGAAPRKRQILQPHWQMAAAAVAAIAMMVGYQAWSPSDGHSDPMVAGTAAARPNSASSYEHSLKFHLASTERQLASLAEVSPEERARLVETIISQNRLYALAAERAGEPQLARVLRAFTPVLESVAGGRDEAAADGIAQLGFEMRVMQARLSGAGAESETL